MTSRVLDADYDRAVTALYRKYRPQDFDDVVGQEAVVRTLRNAIELGQLRQAYLFAGPRGTGKTSMARILAKALNCEPGRPRRPTRSATPASRSPTARRWTSSRWTPPRSAGSTTSARSATASSSRRPRAVQGLHPRRGAPAHGRGLERAAEADRGAAAAPRLRLLHDRLAKVLQTVRSRCQRSSSRGRGCPSSCACCGGSPTPRRSRARRGAGADRARRARLVPRRRVDPRPARLRDREHDRRPVRAPAARGGRGGRALPPLRRNRRP